jgi:class 3 adenylate cyclase/tetratricopeptide (TPR) repeat protein
LRVEVGVGFEIRKTVTILFCDVVGSTALGEKTDPETTRKVMSRYALEMSAVVERHGGTVERFRGDEVMAVFGVPTVHEDDALRAVRAGKEMQRRLAVLNEELVASWGVRLECRIGINTGEVVAGDPAGDESFVTGDAVNVAKRLEQAARPGEILIGTATYPLVKDAGKFGPRYRFSVKGKREPVTPFRLDDVDATAAGYARRLDAPFVGRADELAELLAHVDRSFAERRCTLVLVLGPAGIGKSRLVREATSSLAGRADVVTGRCLSYGTGITYWPLVEILDGLGGLEALEQALAEHEDAEAVLAPLRAAFGVAESDVPSDEVFWAVRRTFEYLAERRPLVVCLDDAHWAEPTLLDLVEYLAAFATGPIVLLCIARAELLEARSGLGSAPRIELEQLLEQETEQLVAALGVDDARVRAQITATADGNPLFAEQLTAAVAESDTPADVDALQLPASISALLEARLDGLEPPERRALERAAIIGKEFWQRAVADLSSDHDRPAIARSLLTLVRKGLIRPTQSRATAQDVYHFRHTLIREAAYTGMPKAVRASLHERYAAWLQQQPDPGTAQDEILGYHLEQAYRSRTELAPPNEATRGLAEDAAEHLLAAGGRAFAREDMPAAAGLLGRAVALLVEEDPRRLSALRDQVQALWEAGRADDALEALTRLLAEAGAAGETRVVALAQLERIVHEQLIGGDSAAVWAAAHRAIELCSAAGDEAGLALAWRRLSSAYRRVGEFAAAEVAAREAVEHARVAGNRQEEARAVDGLCNCLLYGPTPVDAALATCTELLDVGGTRTLEANVLGAVAGLQAMRGDFGAAREAYSRAASILDDLGLELPRAALTQVGVPIELLAGDPVTAEREARRGAETFARFGSAGIQSPLIAEALEAQGRRKEAERELETTPVESGPQLAQWQVRWRIVKSRVCANTGRSAEGVETARKGVSLAKRTDDLGLRGDAYAALATALVVAGRRDEAAEAAASAQASFGAKGSVAAASRIFVSNLSPA